MPKQISKIEITDVSGNPGIINVQIGDFGYEIPEAELFDTTVDFDHIIQNLRLAYLIGNYGALNSDEFIKNRSVNTKSGIWHIKSIELIDANSKQYHVNLSKQKGQSDFGIEIYEADLTDNYSNRSVILKNIGAYLIKEGYKKLTSQLKESLKSIDFWY